MASTKRTVVYGHAAGEALEADAYLPDSDLPAPILICIHGGGWKGGSRRAYRHLGPYLAGAGYAVIAIDYRVGPQHRFPAALNDVRTAIAYAQANAVALGGDAARIALVGDSAGGHLAALAGLTQPHDVKAIVPVFGTYDLAAQWDYDLAVRPNDKIAENFLGAALVDDRRIYFEASPLSYVTRTNNRISVLLAWGTLDDVVPPDQAERFLRALKQAGFYVRTVVQAAPHYWLGDPLDEPGSYSAFFGARLVRFLDERLPPVRNAAQSGAVLRGDGNALP